MKTIFVRAVKKLDVNPLKLKELIVSLSKDINITYSIQYHNLAIHVKSQAEKSGVKVHNFLQIIGCRRLKVLSFPILHIGSGKFHATNPNLFRVSKDITLFDGYSITRVSPNYITDSERVRKAKLSRFFASNNIGLLVSNKYGQQDLNKAIAFANESDKSSSQNRYLFLCNNINKNEFENFPIDFWVNTACPRIEEDSSEIISLDRIKNMKDL